MTQRELNSPLIERIITQLIDHPEQHDQSSFGRKDTPCGTVLCVAGWAIVLSPNVRAVWTNGGILNHVDTEFGLMDPDLAAGYLMGLTGDQMDDLFFSDTSTVDTLAKLKDLLSQAPSAVRS